MDIVVKMVHKKELPSLYTNLKCVGRPDAYRLFCTDVHVIVLVPKLFQNTILMRVCPHY